MHPTTLLGALSKRELSQYSDNYMIRHTKCESKSNQKTKCHRSQRRKGGSAKTKSNLCHFQILQINEIQYKISWKYFRV